ncbi:MAG: flagellar hook-associated protein FlgK [Firmicutes bacterium]|nr:flagellar hook-associated protein FlgK [Alicyclobacillaceae bacterium]MCL6497320.1 flagellar hook-associated protein FlgK [Bacillota bacterium]
MSFMLLNIAGRGLAAQQLALEVTSNNLTNATTPGYHRETAVLEDAPPIPQQPVGEIGEGVDVVTIQRASNAYLSHTLRTQNGVTGYWQELQQVLSQIQPAFQEPSSTGLEEALNQFYATYDQLAQNPENPAYQTAVLQQGQVVAQTFQQIATQIVDAQQQLSQVVTSDINTINTLAQNIAQLNAQINLVQGSGQAPNDLENQRTQYVDQLSQLVNLNYTVGANGEMNIYVGGHTLVAGDQVTTMTVDPSAPVPEPAWVINPTTNPPTTVSALQDLTSGQLKGALDARDQYLANYLDQLNTLAQSLASVVNGQSANTPGLFSSNPSTYNPSNITAQNLYFVANPPTSTNGSTPYQAINSGINQLYQDLVNGTGGPTFIQTYTSLVDQVGSDGQNAQNRANAAETTGQNLTNALQSQVGVDVNQESANLIQEQQSYQAAAQIVVVEQATMSSLLQAIA